MRSVGFELRGEKIHLTTEAQRPQRRAIFLCLSGDADKHKSLSLYEATDIYCVPIQKAHAYINVQNIPEGTNSFHPVVVSSPSRKFSEPEADWIIKTFPLCLRGEKSVSPRPENNKIKDLPPFCHSCKSLALSGVISNHCCPK